MSNIQQTVLRVLLALSAAVALSACEPRERAGGAAPQATDTAQAQPAGDRTHTLTTADGRTRTYVVHLPAGYDAGRSFPAVLALHGGVGTSAIMASTSRLAALADAHGFLVIFPQGASLAGSQQLRDMPTWNAGGCCGYAQREAIDDVAFMRQLVAQVTADYAVDRARVFVTGMSNGGMMAQRLACEAADVFAGAAAVAGSLQLPACAPSRPIPMLIIHGTADASVPYVGGAGGTLATRGITFTPVEEQLRDWSARNQCAGEPASERVPPLVDDGVTIDRIAYTGCAAPVVLYRVNGGAHAWPGGESSRLQEAVAPTQAFDASAAIWAFFGVVGS